MSDQTPFYLTRAGRHYYEATMPELVRQITRLNELLERVIAELDGDKDDQCPT